MAADGPVLRQELRLIGNPAKGRPRSLACNGTRFRDIFRNSRAGGAAKLGTVRTFQYPQSPNPWSLRPSKTTAIFNIMYVALQARARSPTLRGLSASTPFFSLLSSVKLPTASSSRSVYSSFEYTILSLRLFCAAFSSLGVWYHCFDLQKTIPVWNVNKRSNPLSPSFCTSQVLNCSIEQ